MNGNQPPPTARALSEPRWEAWYAVVFAAAVAVVEAGDYTAPARIAVSAALAAMVPWYLCVVRPLLRPLRPTATEAPEPPEPRSRRWRRPLALAVLLGLFAVVQSQNIGAWFLAFALTPLCFRVVEPRALGMGFVIALNTIAGVLGALSAPDLGSRLSVLGVAVFSIGVSSVLSRWVLRVIEQSEERALLIAQLESTRAELAAAHHEAGMLAERHRLAGEIHDTLAQGFTSIVTLVQAALAGVDPDTPARTHLELALTTARENLAEARTLVTALGPAALDEGGLPEALGRAARSSSAHAEVTGIRRALPTGTEVVLLRVCQEALANVRKHAAAERVDVRLHYGERTVTLTVSDDGRGFAARTPTDGFGLRNMRDRVRQAGGTIRVRSTPGEGTVIHAEVPA